MKLLEFWEEISLMPDAVRQLEKLEITEGEYEKLRELFLRDVNLFYEAVKKREDFRMPRVISVNQVIGLANRFEKC